MGILLWSISDRILCFPSRWIPGVNTCPTGARAVLPPPAPQLPSSLMEPRDPPFSFLLQPIDSATPSENSPSLNFILLSSPNRDRLLLGFSQYLIWRRRLLIRFSPIPVAGPVRLGLMQQGNIIRSGRFQTISHLPQREVGGLLLLRNTTAALGDSGGSPSAFPGQQQPDTGSSCQLPTRPKLLSLSSARLREWPSLSRLPPECPVTARAPKEQQERTGGFSPRAPSGPQPRAPLDLWELGGEGGGVQVYRARFLPKPKAAFFFLVISRLRSELCQPGLSSSSFCINARRCYGLRSLTTCLNPTFTSSQSEQAPQDLDFWKVSHDWAERDIPSAYSNRPRIHFIVKIGPRQTSSCIFISGALHFLKLLCICTQKHNSFQYGF